MVEILHDVRRLIWAFFGCKFDMYTKLIRWFKFCMCLQEVKWTIVLMWEREKKCFFFDTSVTFYVSLFCDSGLYMHCRLCDSFFHLFLPTLVRMGSYNPPLLLVKLVGSRPGSTFCWSWVQYFCKWYQQATLYCITFCRCCKVSGTLRLLVRDSTPAEALCCVLGQDMLSAG